MARLLETKDGGELALIQNPDSEMQGGFEAGTGDTKLWFSCIDNSNFTLTLNGPFIIDTARLSEFYWEMRREIRNGDGHQIFVLEIDNAGRIDILTIDSKSKISVYPNPNTSPH